MGVAKIFTPGATIASIVDWVVDPRRPRERPRRPS